MDNNEKQQQQQVARSQVHSFVHFASENDKTRRLNADLFGWGILFSTYSRSEEGSFNKKPNKTCFYGQRDFPEIILMLFSALNDFTAGKEFEYAVKSKKGAFGAWGIKKEDRLVAGLCIYDVDENGNVVQRAKDVVPILNNNRVVKMSPTGEVDPIVQEAFKEQVSSFIKQLAAIGHGTSNIYTAHLTKMGQLNNNNSGARNPEATSASSSADTTDDDEFPF